MSSSVVFLLSNLAGRHVDAVSCKDDVCTVAHLERLLFHSLYDAVALWVCRGQRMLCHGRAAQLEQGQGHLEQLLLGAAPCSPGVITVGHLQVGPQEWSAAATPR